MRHKQTVYGDLDLTIVAPSSWALKASSESILLGSFRHVLIPNGIDQAIFRPLNRDEARRQLLINDRRPAILFIAHVAYDNPRKGTDILLASLRELLHKHDFSLIVVGENSHKWCNKLSVPVHSFEFTQDRQMLSLIYNACDIVCVPSSSDNLPNTVLIMPVVGHLSLLILVVLQMR